MFRNVYIVRRCASVGGGPEFSRRYGWRNRMIWKWPNEGLAEVDKCQKIKVLGLVWEYFSSVGALQLINFSRFPANITLNFEIYASTTPKQVDLEEAQIFDEYNIGIAYHFHQKNWGVGLGVNKILFDSISFYRTYDNKQ